MRSSATDAGLNPAAHTAARPRAIEVPQTHIVGNFVPLSPPSSYYRPLHDTQHAELLECLQTAMLVPANQNAALEFRVPAHLVDGPTRRSLTQQKAIKRLNHVTPGAPGPPSRLAKRLRGTAMHPWVAVSRYWRSRQDRSLDVHELTYDGSPRYVITAVRAVLEASRSSRIMTVRGWVLPGRVAHPHSGRDHRLADRRLKQYRREAARFPPASGPVL